MYPIFTFTSAKTMEDKPDLDRLSNPALYDFFHAIGSLNGWWDFELRTDRFNWKVYLDAKAKQGLGSISKVDERNNSNSSTIFVRYDRKSQKVNLESKLKLVNGLWKVHGVEAVK
jgi:hypothetical protein